MEKIIDFIALIPSIAILLFGMYIFCLVPYRCYQFVTNKIPIKKPDELRSLEKLAVLFGFICLIGLFLAWVYCAYFLIYMIYIGFTGNLTGGFSGIPIGIAIIFFAIAYPTTMFFLSPIRKVDNEKLNT
jgi:hypothetical protein